MSVFATKNTQAFTFFRCRKHAAQNEQRHAGGELNSKTVVVTDSEVGRWCGAGGGCGGRWVGGRVFISYLLIYTITYSHSEGSQSVHIASNRVSFFGGSSAPQRGAAPLEMPAPVAGGNPRSWALATVCTAEDPPCRGRFRPALLDAVDAVGLVELVD